MYFYNASEMVTIPTLTSNLWDRAGILTPNTSIVPLTPISTATNSKSFSALCEERSEELANLAKATGKKMFVFWSGGLDSTAALLSLRETLDTTQLVVVYNEQSELEYPGFLESNIFGAYETVLLDTLASWRTVEECCSKGIIVTGEISDQIFGSGHFTRIPKEELKKHWTLYHPAFTASKLVHTYVESCPKRVNTVAEMLWWFNYTTKYQSVQLRFLLDNEVSVLNENIVHFFDSTGFNDYAVSADIEEKIPDFDVKYYKMPLREVIASLSGDNTYAFNKPKIPSLRKSYGRFSISLVAKTIATDWSRGY